MPMNYQTLADLLNPQEEESMMSSMTPDQATSLQQQEPPLPENYNQLAQEEALTLTPTTPQPITRNPQNPFMQGVPDIDSVMAGLPKEDSPALPNSTAPEAPMTRTQALLAEYNRLAGRDQEALAEARSSDRMLKVGGALGDALATYLNAQGQMNVKAPGVQVQQGAGLGKIADMFATAPEVASDAAQRREALMKQYGELSKGERAQTQLETQKELAKDRATLQKELLDRRLESDAKIAGMKAAQPTFEDKEKIKAAVKEDKAIAKENRAIKEKLDPTISNLDKQIQYVDKALKLLINPKTGKVESDLTGPYDKYKASFTKKGQSLEDALKNISLNKMIEMFAGMSKAIDSDAERAFFQAAQPSLEKYEDVNVEVLKEMKANLESLRNKSQAKLREIEGSKQNQPPYGEFTEMDGKSYRWNPAVNKYQLIPSK